MVLPFARTTTATEGWGWMRSMPAQMWDVHKSTSRVYYAGHLLKILMPTERNKGRITQETGVAALLYCRNCWTKLTAYKTPIICAMDVSRKFAKWSLPALITPRIPTWIQPKKYVPAVILSRAGYIFITGACTTLMTENALLQMISDAGFMLK